MGRPEESVVANMDQWDRRDWERMAREIAAFAASTEKLADFVETGEPFMGDAYCGLAKVAPELKPRNSLDPVFQVNHMVMEAAAELPEWERLKPYTEGDPVATAQACITLEPDFETLFDREKQRMDQAKDLQQKMQDIAALQAQHDALQEVLAELVELYGEDDEGGQGDIEAVTAVLTEMAEELGEEIRCFPELRQRFDEALDNDRLTAKTILRGGLERAIEEASDNQSMADAFGIEPGELKRMSADERIALAKKLNNPRLKQIAALFGSMMRLALTTRWQTTDQAKHQLVGLELGRDIPYVLPSELAKRNHPILRREFQRDYVEGRLLQYRLEGKEKVGKGAIILCEDGSYSMAGPRELYAKAVMLVLLEIARKEGRDFHLIHFGSRGQVKCLSFTTPEDFTVDRIVEAAELFFAGGTDFVTPLSVALERLQQEHQRTGRVDGDIVFLTDGECAVPEEFLAEFKAEQARLRFDVWGIAMFCDDRTTLDLICDGRVAEVAELLNGGPVKEVFAGV